MAYCDLDRAGYIAIEKVLDTLEIAIHNGDFETGIGKRSDAIFPIAIGKLRYNNRDC